MLFVYDDFLLLCMLVVDDIYVAAHHDDTDVIYSVSLHQAVTGRILAPADA